MTTFAIGDTLTMEVVATLKNGEQIGVFVRDERTGNTLYLHTHQGYVVRLGQYERDQNGQMTLRFADGFVESVGTPPSLLQSRIG